MASADPYQTLGVPKTATQDQIKNAYRNLAKKFHPDLNPGASEAEHKFKEINQAYETIGTPENRAKFDRGEVGGAPFGGGADHARGPFYYETQQPGGGRYSTSFGEGLDEDLFESLFGARTGGARSARHARGPTRGEDLHFRMEIDFKDAVLGAERQITLPSSATLAVRIPPGVTDGTRLRFAGQGSPSAAGGPPGDAYVEIQVRKDPRFQVQGENVVTELPVSVTDAVFGAEVRVPTIEGEVMLRIPPRSNTGTTLRLNGLGLLDRKTGRRGDQHVKLRVMLPRTIDPELEEALRQWQRRQTQRGSAA